MLLLTGTEPATVDEAGRLENFFILRDEPRLLCGVVGGQIGGIGPSTPLVDLQQLRSDVLGWYGLLNKCGVGTKRLRDNSRCDSC